MENVSMLRRVDVCQHTLTDEDCYVVTFTGQFSTFKDTWTCLVINFVKNILTWRVPTSNKIKPVKIWAQLVIEFAVIFA